jgi:predicted DsbA family dithiol-disulfide isomerase
LVACVHERVRTGGSGHCYAMVPLSPQPAAHAVVVYSDIGCPWAHIAVHRLHRERRRLGLDGEVTVDHRAFPLELVNQRPTPKELLDVEIEVCAELEPDAGWNQDPPAWTYPVSTLPALEAVQAAKAQDATLSEALDHALRRAMFAQWRCLSVFSDVLDVAGTVEGIDVDALWDEIRSGRPRTDVFHQWDLASTDRVAGSPTFVLWDGSSHHNPGVEMHWVDGPGSELVVDRNDASVLADLVERAAALSPSD